MSNATRPDSRRARRSRSAEPIAAGVDIGSPKVTAVDIGCRGHTWASQRTQRDTTTRDVTVPLPPIIDTGKGWRVAAHETPVTP